jgi:transcription initiation factor TFIIH subunit 4
VKITTEGFQFLLQDQKTQVWKLLKKYLDSAEQRQQNKIELLQFLFMLSFLETGRPYLLKTLTPTQLALLKDLRGFGLVYNKKDSEVYYPTQFATGLIHENGASWTQKDRGYIIVETNYRVYAYTSSVLDIDLLSLFVSMEMRTPNLVVGLISRESVITAFKSGITADQVFQFRYCIHLHLYRF